jgi:predicted Zn finger-like uncharacterized protein
MFRVVADQLKLRGGLVRCGSCRHVFDAIGSLSYVDDAGLVAGAQERTAKPSAAAQSDAPARTAATGPVTLRIEPAALHDLPAGGHRDELGPPTLLAAGAAGDRASGDAAAERAEGMPPEAPPPTSAVSAEDAGSTAAGANGGGAPEPAFLRERRRPGRGFSIIFGGGSLLLLSLLVAQLAIVFRIELLMRLPSARPVLVELCRHAGCSIGWPTRADMLAVVGSELQAVPGTDILELTATIRNRASFTLALPAIEVTLTDIGNRILVRKVFAPVDYLASSGEPASVRLDEGIGSGADYTIRISFEARGISAAGFVVYPFYL